MVQNWLVERSSVSFHITAFKLIYTVSHRNIMYQAGKFHILLSYSTGIFYVKANICRSYLVSSIFFKKPYYLISMKHSSSEELLVNDGTERVVRTI